MRVSMVVALLMALTASAAHAEAACTMQHATYKDAENGYELRFRPARSWESFGMTKHVFELVRPDGKTAWGTIGENMGTSRDVGHLFYGCDQPGPDDAPLDDAAVEACQIWESVVYAIDGGRADFTPMADEPAAPSLLLSDIGRKVRYSGFAAGPGDEPWDQFDLSGCEQPG